MPAAAALGQPAAGARRHAAGERKHQTADGRVADVHADDLDEIGRRPAIEGFADQRQAEIHQAHLPQLFATQQQAQHGPRVVGRLGGGWPVRRAFIRLRQASVTRSGSQRDPRAGGEDSEDGAGQVEEAAPADAQFDEAAEQQPRRRVADQITHRQHAHDRRLPRRRKPAGRDARQRRPAHRLHKPIRRPRRAQHDDAGSQTEEERADHRRDHAEQENAPAVEEVGNQSVDQLATGVQQHADAHDGAEHFLRDAVLAGFLDQHRRRDRQVRAAQIVAGIADQQRDDRDALPASQSRGCRGVHREPLREIETTEGQFLTA